MLGCSNLSLIAGGVALVPLSLSLVSFRRQLPLALSVSLTHIAASGISVAFAATDLLATRSIRLLGKDPSTGRVSALGALLFWPYHLSLQAMLHLKRIKNSAIEPLMTHVQDGWYIGGWPYAQGCLPPGGLAVVDVTCELPRRAIGGSYLCLPVWDSMAPSQGQITSAVEWALEQRKAGREVLVHCAHGHGRSCIVLCALLVAAGLAADSREAFRLVRLQRPRVRLNKHQLPGLLAWEEAHAAAAAGVAVATGVGRGTK